MFKNMAQSGGGLPGSAPNPLASTVARDAMLVYARRIFHAPPVPESEDSSSRAESVKSFYRTNVLPLLQNLRTLHPRHVPCLLLLGCVYHAVGDYAESLAINDELLEVDENFVSPALLWPQAMQLISPLQVEAMSNKGTTLKATGETERAIDCWWKAVYLRPTYWDAVVRNLSTCIVDKALMGWYRITCLVCLCCRNKSESRPTRIVYTPRPFDCARLSALVCWTALDNGCCTSHPGRSIIFKICYSSAGASGACRRSWLSLKDYPPSWRPWSFYFTRPARLQRKIIRSGRSSSPSTYVRCFARLRCRSPSEDSQQAWDTTTWAPSRTMDVCWSSLMAGVMNCGSWLWRKGMACYRPFSCRRSKHQGC